MTQAKRHISPDSVTTSLTRRRVVAVTAAALAAGAALKAIAIARPMANAVDALPPAAKPDPVFAMIERHRTMWDAVEAKHDWIDEQLYEAASEVRAVLDELPTTAKTLAGFAAVLRYWAQHEDTNSLQLEEYQVAFLNEFAGALERLEVR
jgi:hypothetical protein